MLNRVILIGRLTADPELRYTPNGNAVCNFTLAVNRHYSDESDFIKIVVWKKSAEMCAEHLKKGHKAAVEGRMQNNSFEDRNGKKVIYTEVVADYVRFLEGKKSEPKNDPFEDEGKPIDISEDELPF